MGVLYVSVFYFLRKAILSHFKLRTFISERLKAALFIEVIDGSAEAVEVQVDSLSYFLNAVICLQ